MIDCRFLTPCGLCEIKSMIGLPVKCEKNVDYVPLIYPPTDREKLIKEIKTTGERLTKEQGVSSK